MSEAAIRDPVPLEQIRRALVVILRHHGDTLLAAPVLGALKAQAPHAEIDALVYDDTALMLQGHPALARLHVVGRSWKKQGAVSRFSSELQLHRELRERSFDLLVHLTEQPRGAWLARGLSPRWSVAPVVPDRGDFWRNSFTHLFQVARNGRRHRVEANLDALRRIGLHPSPEQKRVQFVPGAEAEARVATLLGAEGISDGSFIHLHPASRWSFKCWPADKNAALVDQLSGSHRVVITSAPEEKPFIERVLSGVKAKPVNLAGKLSIKELGALTACARLFIGVDSMPMHLASAMGTRTVALFGPSGEFQWGPWNVEHRVIRTSHSCRPCGQDGCGGGKVSECLVFLSVDAVHAAARELLAK